MTAFAEEAGLSFDRVDRGILHFYKSEAEFAHAHNATAMLAKAGLSRRRLTANEVYDIEPALNAFCHWRVLHRQRFHWGYSQIRHRPGGSGAPAGRDICDEHGGRHHQASR